MILSILVFSGLFAQEHEGEYGNCQHQEPQPFIGIQAFTIENIGEFGKDWSDGGGINLTYGILYSNQFALIFNTGYMKQNPSENVEYYGDPSLTMIPFAVGVRYYFLVDRIRPFLLANSGFNYISQDYAKADTVVAESGSYFHFQVGVGLGILLFEGLEAEFQAKYNSHLLEPSIPYNITGVEYGIALNWHFY